MGHRSIGSPAVLSPATSTGPGAVARRQQALENTMVGILARAQGRGSRSSARSGGRLSSVRLRRLTAPLFVPVTSRGLQMTKQAKEYSMRDSPSGEMRDMQLKVRELTELLASRKELNTRLSAENRRLQQVVVDLQTRVTDLEAGRPTKKGEAASLSAMKTIAADIKRQQAAAQRELQATAALAQDLEAGKSEVGRQALQLQYDLSVARGELAEAKTTAARLADERATLEEKVAALAAQLEKATVDNELMKAVCGQLQEAAAASTVQYEQQSASQAEVVRGTLQQQLDAAQAELHGLRSRLQQAASCDKPPSDWRVIRSRLGAPNSTASSAAAATAVASPAAAAAAGAAAVVEVLLHDVVVDAEALGVADADVWPLLAWELPSGVQPVALSCSFGAAAGNGEGSVAKTRRGSFSGSSAVPVKSLLQIDLPASADSDSGSAASLLATTQLPLLVYNAKAAVLGALRCSVVAGQPDQPVVSVALRGVGSGGSSSGDDFNVVALYGWDDAASALGALVATLGCSADHHGLPGGSMPPGSVLIDLNGAADDSAALLVVSARVSGLFVDGPELASKGRRYQVLSFADADSRAAATARVLPSLAVSPDPLAGCVPLGRGSVPLDAALAAPTRAEAAKDVMDRLLANQELGPLPYGEFSQRHGGAMIRLEGSGNGAVVAGAARVVCRLERELPAAAAPNSPAVAPLHHAAPGSFTFAAAPLAAAAPVSPAADKMMRRLSEASAASRRQSEVGSAAAAAAAAPSAAVSQSPVGLVSPYPPPAAGADAVAHVQPVAALPADAAAAAVGATPQLMPDDGYSTVSEEEEPGVARNIAMTVAR